MPRAANAAILELFPPGAQLRITKRLCNISSTTENCVVPKVVSDVGDQTAGEKYKVGG
jgi:hypothetical protein